MLSSECETGGAGPRDAAASCRAIRPDQSKCSYVTDGEPRRSAPGATILAWRIKMANAIRFDTWVCRPQWLIHPLLRKGGQNVAGNFCSTLRRGGGARGQSSGGLEALLNIRQGSTQSVEVTVVRR